MCLSVLLTNKIDPGHLQKGLKVLRHFLTLLQVGNLNCLANIYRIHNIRVPAKYNIGHIRNIHQIPMCFHFELFRVCSGLRHVINIEQIPWLFTLKWREDLSRAKKEENYWFLHSAVSLEPLWLLNSQGRPVFLIHKLCSVLPGGTPIGQQASSCHQWARAGAVAGGGGSQWTGSGHRLWAGMDRPGSNPSSGSWAGDLGQGT